MYKTNLEVLVERIHMYEDPRRPKTVIVIEESKEEILPDMIMKMHSEIVNTKGFLKQNVCE